MLNLIVNGMKISSEKKKTIVEFLKEQNIDVPTLCYDDRIENEQKCGICAVEINGELKRACETLIEDNMKIKTHSPKVMMERARILNNIVATHTNDCVICSKSGDCKLKKYCLEYNIHSYKNNQELTYSNSENPRAIELDSSNPFYQIDPNRCIACGNCIAVCSNLQCNNDLELKEKNGRLVVGAKKTEKINDSTCVSCGNCVSVCPVGALTAKSKKVFASENLKIVRTTCSYCGVGCQIDFSVKDNEIVDASPANIAPNDGLLCVKGKFGYKFVNHPDRLQRPLIRKNGVLVESTYEEAYEYISKKMKDIKEKFGSDAFAGLSSARCTNEDNFMFQKLFRGVLGTNNIDHCARL